MLYTVLLEYPRDMTDGNTELFRAHVTAKTIKKAIALARAEVLDKNGLSSNPKDDNYQNPMDFGCLAVFHGHLIDIKP